MSHISELQARREATQRLYELAMSTQYRDPVQLLSRALEDTRVFLPAEVASSVEIILDAALPTERSVQ